MNNASMVPNSRRNLEESIRAVRARYDQLGRGEVATVRRAKTAKALALEGVYWRIASGGPSRMDHVVLHFPLLAQRSTSQRFSFGRFLRHALGESNAASLRFRRVLDSRDDAELDHRLRGLLRLAARDAPSLDWGVLGADICWFFAESDNVRRRWAQDFYAPGEHAAEDPAPDALANPQGDKE